MRAHRLLAVSVALLACGAGVVSAEEELTVSGILQRARDVAATDGSQVRGVGARPLVPFPRVGHNIPSHPSLYNIWSNNCHTQSNLFAALASGGGRFAGVLVCQGNPESDPMYHTANWSVDPKGQTCIYNWGTPCCWDDVAPQPNIASGPGLVCAQGACGTQHSASQTRVMPSGMLVEAPGPHSCSILAAGGPLNMNTGRAVAALGERLRTRKDEVRVPAFPDLPEGAVLNFSTDRMDKCLDCCSARASLWAGVPEASVTANLAKGREAQFRVRCLSACRGSFTPGIQY